MNRRMWKTALVLTVALAAGGVTYQTALADGIVPSADSAGISAEKLALEAQDRLQHQQLEAKAADPKQQQATIDAKNQSAQQAARERANQTVTEPAWPVGIFEDSEAPASSSQFRGTNRWVGTVAGLSVAVYAGQAGEDPSTGRLLVMTADRSIGVQAARFTVDLPGAGSLRVASARAATLTITDSRGAARIFDVAARKWVS